MDEVQERIEDLRRDVEEAQDLLKIKANPPQWFTRMMQSAKQALDEKIENFVNTDPTKHDEKTALQGEIRALWTVLGYVDSVIEAGNQAAERLTAIEEFKAKEATKDAIR